MGYNTFGKKLRVTTWGESHGRAIGGIIDGMPSNIPITSAEINQALKLRAPGNSIYTSMRKELDQVEILSGVFNDKTTGAPISLLIHNQDVDSSKYEAIKDIIRPGHIDYTYHHKYKNYDYRGGGRGSARETAIRVAASVLAKKLLAPHNIEFRAYLQQVADFKVEYPYQDLANVDNSAIYCPNQQISTAIEQYLLQIQQAGDSIGGIVGFSAINVPVGLGEPVYYKVEAVLANAMLSIPAAKGFEIGSGFAAACQTGSQHNDAITIQSQQVAFVSNNSGGSLGGITNGQEIYGRVAFKAPSSIYHRQRTITKDNQATTFSIPSGSRHDPCLAIRAVKVVEAMGYLVLADLYLQASTDKM